MVYFAYIFECRILNCIFPSKILKQHFKKYKKLYLGNPTSQILKLIYLLLLLSLCYDNFLSKKYFEKKKTTTTTKIKNSRQRNIASSFSSYFLSRQQLKLIKSNRWLLNKKQSMHPSSYENLCKKKCSIKLLILF